MKKYISTAFLICILLQVDAQKVTVKSSNKPKLVVGLVIDQMRWDYLYRYSEMYSNNGFKRLLTQGFTAENAMIPYTPTYTAPGHTCVYTGSVPALHGIVGNSWYDKSRGKVTYCTDDTTIQSVGTNGNAGKMSPANMHANTITDELRINSNFKNKVIGIALKDRGAILPAGHSGNAAYWYDNGNWISSTYYMKSLPQWVTNFNDKKIADAYMSGQWKTLYKPELYSLSTADDKSYEGPIRGLKTVTFPHDLSIIAERDKKEAFRTTPFANTFTLDFAKDAVMNEQLGKSESTDFLAVSLSSTDYIGHMFGPNSIEIQDTYLRLDKDLADFLQFLDKNIGLGNYTLFLTADHGVAHVPGFLTENKMPGGIFSDDEFQKKINEKVKEKFGIERAIVSAINYQFYFNETVLVDKTRYKELCEFVIEELRKEPIILQAFVLENAAQTNLPEPQKSMMINGYDAKRSGQIQFTFKPGYFEHGSKGTSHGLWNPYDSHIPCVFFGWGVKPGKTHRETYMTDIAATVAAILKIQMPNACVGKPIFEAIK